MFRLTRSAVQRVSRVPFSTSALRLSNIGREPILIPEGTTLKVTNKALDEVTVLRAELDRMRQGKPKIHLTKELTVTGPQGSMSLDLADFINLNVAENRAEVRVPEPDSKPQKTMWGTTRTLISNAVTGVNEGHLCIVKLVGTGFRAQLDNIPDSTQQQLVLRVGFSVPRVAVVPTDLKVTVPVPHRIIIEGCDKQKVMSLAATIRAFRKPEPYKGKGIFINDETIKLKQKKIK